MTLEDFLKKYPSCHIVTAANGNVSLFGAHDLPATGKFDLFSLFDYSISGSYSGPTYGLDKLEGWPVIIRIAKYHLGRGNMADSARSCYDQAIDLIWNGEKERGIAVALRSIAFSVGICHADYALAFQHAGISGEVRLVN